MAKRRKPINLEDCPDILQKIITLVDKEVDALTAKDSLSTEDSKNLIAFAGCISGIYKEYKEEMKTIRKDLNSLTKEQIQAIAKLEAGN